MDLREAIEQLKIALEALSDARDSYDKDDPRDGFLRWLIQDVRGLLGEELVSIELGEAKKIHDKAQDWFDEAGAKLSKESKASIAAAIAALTELLGDEDEVAEAAKGSEKQDGESTSDCVSRKISVIKKEKPNTDDKQAAAIAHSMCEANVSDEDAPSLIEEYAAKLEITLAETTEVPVAEVEPDAVDGILEANDRVIRSAVTLLRESESSKDGSAFDVLVIKAGRSLNGVEYPASVLKESAPLLEGRPMYIDHPSRASGGERSMRDKVGWYSNVSYVESIAESEDAEPTGGITATLNLYTNSGSPWFREMVMEAIERDRPQDIGISIMAGGKVKVKKDKDGVYKEVEKITVFASADAVAEPGAGGQPLALVASVREDQDVEILKKARTLREILEGAPQLSMDEIREARPDLFNEDGSPNWEAGVEVTPDPTESETTVTESAPATVTSEAPSGITNDQFNTLMESNNRLLRAEMFNTLDRILSESQLPRSLWAKVRERVEASSKVLTEAELREIAGEFEDILAVASPGGGEPSAAYPTPSLVVPFGSVREGANPVDLAQAALDQWFGNEISDDLKPKVGRINSLKEYYVQVTGDVNFDGVYNPNYSVLREALPTAAALVGDPPQGGGVTFSGLFGTSMNRALVRLYRQQRRWWEPIVQKTDLSNMKQQDRIRTHNFGSLTERTQDGLEYTELTWGETAENYTPTEYGNVVTVGRRALINDDTRAIQRMPQHLARSAIVTINEYMSNLFTQNAGAGPAMADTFNVFDNANHQGNSVTTALSRSALLALRTVMQKFNDDAGKRLDIMPRHILVPVDLEDTAWELWVSPQVPDSANNAQNLIADGDRGIRSVITVPQWTDANNWYLMADPADADGIELGFLFGREEPELLSQQDPLSGLVWTNDVMSFKVRWDFGADWVDYRAAAAAIVA